MTIQFDDIARELDERAVRIKKEKEEKEKKKKLFKKNIDSIFNDHELPMKLEKVFGKGSVSIHGSGQVRLTMTPTKGDGKRVYKIALLPGYVRVYRDSSIIASCELDIINSEDIIHQRLTKAIRSMFRDAYQRQFHA